MSDFIILGLVIITIYLFYQFLSKQDFNLNGLELIIYELAFILNFQIGSYYVKFQIHQADLGIFLLILLGIYYLLKTLKTQQYTKIWIISIYILLFFVNSYSTKQIPTEGMGDLGLGFTYIIFTFGSIIYILLMNFISFIIKSIKKENLVKNINSKIKPLYKSVFKILILVIVILLSISYIKFDKYLYNKIEAPYKEKVYKHLKEKYTDFDFEVYTNNYENESECRSGECYLLNPTFNVYNKTTKTKFFVYFYDNKIDDNLINMYYHNNVEYRYRNNYFSKMLSVKFNENNFNVSIDIKVGDFDEKKAFDFIGFSKEEDFLYFVPIEDLTVIINDKFNSNESFEEYAIELYKYYESYIGKYNQYRSIKYKFSNPELNNNIIFKNGGSIDKLQNEITVYYSDINR